MCKVPFCHPQYNKKAVFLEFYCLLSIYFWGRVFDNLGGAGEQIKILGHLFTPVSNPNLHGVTAPPMNNFFKKSALCWFLFGKIITSVTKKM